MLEFCYFNQVVVLFRPKRKERKKANQVMMILCWVYLTKPMAIGNMAPPIRPC